MSRICALCRSLHINQVYVGPGHEKVGILCLVLSELSDKEPLLGVGVRIIAKSLLCVKKTVQQHVWCHTGLWN